MLTVLENNIIGYKTAQKPELKIDYRNIDNFFTLKKQVPRIRFHVCSLIFSGVYEKYNISGKLRFLKPVSTVACFKFHGRSDTMVEDRLLQTTFLLGINFGSRKHATRNIRLPFKFSWKARNKISRRKQITKYNLR